MNEFYNLKQYYYHHVSAGPFEKRTDELLHSDIVLHLPVLEYYASLCDHVTEFGVRNGHSTVALIAGCKGDVHSYDIEETEMNRRIQQMPLPCRWRFHKQDTTSPDLVIEETDLLLFDTNHTYEHLKKELRHAQRVRKYLVFHDTLTCGEKDFSGPNPSATGILPAINEFLVENPGYQTVYRTDICNGLWILAKQPGLTDVARANTSDKGLLGLLGRFTSK